MSSGKKVLRSSENGAKTDNIENNGAQKDVKYGVAPSPYRHPHSHHHHLPPPYYQHRYPPLRTPPRPLPLSQPPPDNLLTAAREHSPQVTEQSQERQKHPTLPRSAFMCFKDSKKQEIMAKQSNKGNEKKILQIFSREWRKLSDKERAYWEEQAREDKLRYVREKNDFKGTWHLPKKRAKKHPGAPKRPMSAFLNFSQKVRQQVKNENPDILNTDVSRLLGEMWCNASPAEKALYIEEELKERADYKEKMQKFREEQASLDAATRVSHQSAVNGHQLCQQPEPKTIPKPYPSFERTTRGSPSNISLENFMVDPSKDEPARRSSAFRLHPSQQYHRPVYHHPEYYFPEGYPQVTWSALSMDETDPLPAIPHRGQSHYQPPTNQVSSEDYHMHSAYYPARGNSQYPDPFDVSRFPRYP